MQGSCSARWRTITAWARTGSRSAWPGDRLSPLLPMRLDLDFWSPSSTTLELIPGRLVRPTAEYFRAGNALIDSLTYSLSPQRGAA